LGGVVVVCRSAGKSGRQICNKTFGINKPEKAKPYYPIDLQIILNEYPFIYLSHQIMNYNPLPLTSVNGKIKMKHPGFSPITCG
jgi:hypothetical protein